MLRALLWFAFVFDAAALKAGVLSKALKRKDGRPLVVHIWDPNPTQLESFAIDDVSEACRKAGASALLADPALVGPLAKEQEAPRGNFPGPLPVIADCPLKDLDAEVCTGAKNLGASGIGIRYHHGDYPEDDALEGALKDAVTTAVAAGRMCSS